MPENKAPTAMTARAGQLALLGVWSLTVLGLVPEGAAHSQLEPAALAQSSVGLGHGEPCVIAPQAAARDSLPAPDDPAYPASSGEYFLQWPLHALEAVNAWTVYPGAYFDATTRPETTPIIAVIGTGVDPNHPDFLNSGASSAEVADGGQLLLSASRTFLSWEGEPQQGATDEHGHGTHLAGIIAAATNNGETAGSGIAGLAYPVRLLPVKVADESGVATYADIANAIIYAADQGAAVILIAFAGPTWSEIAQEAVDYAWDRGCLVVAPAGDAVSDQPMFPAACPHVFGVAPTTADGTLAWYASSGHQVALSGPGGDDIVGVYSTLPTYACTLRPDLTGPPYGSLFGSAQAAAHVAAAAGLWTGLHESEASPEARNRLLWQALQQSASALPGAGEGWEAGGGYGVVCPVSLLSGEAARQASTGSIVGRALDGGEPVIGKVVTAVPAGGGEFTTTTLWPAGGYRVANLAPGICAVSVSSGAATGVWEGVVVRPGCDTPGVDFWLGSAAADADVAGAALPQAAVCGRETPITVTFLNTGDATWRRREGHCLRYVGDPAATDPEAAQWELPAGAAVAPGESHEFALTWPAPARYGFYEVAFQMCQQGGAGRFGEVAHGVVSVSSFLDVPPDHWAVGWVEAVKAAGIVRGYAGDLYHPDEAVSRAAMAVYISRALAGGDGNVPTGPETATFPDVPSDHWAYRYIEYAHANGIVQGYWNGYHPDELVNRAQMAVYIARSMVAPAGDSAIPDPTPPATFADVPDTHWAWKWVEYCYDHGVVQGYWNGYHPDETVNRAQMAVFVQRAFELPM